MKKKLMILLIVILAGAGLFGMKKYTDSYTANGNNKAENNLSVDKDKEDKEDKEEKKENQSEITEKIDKDKTEEKDKADENGEKEEKGEEEAEKKDEEQEQKYNESTDFTLVDLEGNEVSLSDYKGKKVFVNFWATWCGPCRKEMPDVQKIYDEVDSEDLVILAVNVGESKEDVKYFIDQGEFSFKVLLDSEMEVAAKYGVTAFPTSVLIDENGDPITGVRGMMSYDQMKDFISKEKEE